MNKLGRKPFPFDFCYHLDSDLVYRSSLMFLNIGININKYIFFSEIKNNIRVTGKCNFSWGSARQSHYCKLVCVYYLLLSVCNGVLTKLPCLHWCWGLGAIMVIRTKWTITNVFQFTGIERHLVKVLGKWRFRIHWGSWNWNSALYSPGKG